MINADKFKEVFGLYATELWAMSEKEFLEWLNSEHETPEEETARWIDDESLVDIGDYANCSKCGYQIDVHEERGYLSFCPNCGRKMR